MHRMGLITSKMLKSPKFCNLKVLILSILTLVSCNAMKTHDDRSPGPTFCDFNTANLVCKPECGITTIIGNFLVLRCARQLLLISFR
jgi:hypothetical protein